MCDSAGHKVGEVRPPATCFRRFTDEAGSIVHPRCGRCRRVTEGLLRDGDLPGVDVVSLEDGYGTRVAQQVHGA